MQYINTQNQKYHEYIVNKTTQFVTQKVPDKFAVHYTSWETRKKVLGLVTAFQPVDLKNHLFPLPPVLEQQKVAKIQVLEARRAQLIETVNVSSARRSETLAQLRGLENRDSIITNEMAKKTLARNECLSVQKTQAITEEGDEIFHFGRIKDKHLEVPVLFPNYTLRHSRFNCKFQVKRQEGHTITFEIVPHFINFSMDSGRRWYITLWAEYSGQLIYKDTIARLTEEIAGLTIEQQKVQEQQLASKLISDESDKKLIRHRERLIELGKELTALNREFFAFDQIKFVIDLITTDLSMST